MTDWYRRPITHPTPPLTVTATTTTYPLPPEPRGMHDITALTNGVQSGATGSDLT